MHRVAAEELQGFGNRFQRRNHLGIQIGLANRILQIDKDISPCLSDPVSQALAQSKGQKVFFSCKRGGVGCRFGSDKRS
jgi:hypothetical protein